MGWDKKHDWRKPIKWVKCINPVGCRLLHYTKYGVLEENETQYLIQFKSRAAKWYSKERFEDYVIPPPPQEPEQDLFNQLF